MELKEKQRVMEEYWDGINKNGFVTNNPKLTEEFKKIN